MACGFPHQLSAPWMQPQSADVDVFYVDVFTWGWGFAQ